MAPEGHRPRPRRLQPLADLDRRRRRRSARSRARYTFKVNRKEQRAALRSALSLHAERGSIAILDAGAFNAPKTRQARRPARRLGARTAPTLVVLAPEESAAALSFRNLTRVAVLSAADVGVTDCVGAASLLVSEAALVELTARAGKPSARARRRRGGKA